MKVKINVCITIISSFSKRFLKDGNRKKNINKKEIGRKIQVELDKRCDGWMQGDNFHVDIKKKEATFEIRKTQFEKKRLDFTNQQNFRNYLNYSPSLLFIYICTRQCTHIIF